MKRISSIFLSGIIALCLLAGCGSQSQKPAGSSVEPTGSSVSEKTEAKTSYETVSNDDTAAPVSNDLKNINDVKIPDNKATGTSIKKTSVSDSNGTKTFKNSSTKVTDTGNNTKTPASNVSQDANVQKNNSGKAGGYRITEQNKDTVTLPRANYELDFDKDGTISSADYKLSGMSQDDFASKLVSNGNVGTSTEARQLINGEITVMCGMFSGTCNKN